MISLTASSSRRDGVFGRDTYGLSESITRQIEFSVGTGWNSGCLFHLRGYFDTLFPLEPIYLWILQRKHMSIRESQGRKKPPVPRRLEVQLSPIMQGLMWFVTALPNTLICAYRLPDFRPAKMA